MSQCSKGSVLKNHSGRKTGGGKKTMIAAGDDCPGISTAITKDANILKKVDSMNKKKKNKSRKKAKEETAKVINQKKYTYYRPYMDKKAVDDGLKKGSLIKGVLRVSQRNTGECFIENTSGDGFSDYLILGIRDRNRALNGDVVIIAPKQRNSWVMHAANFRRWEAARKLVLCNQTNDDAQETNYVVDLPCHAEDELVVDMEENSSQEFCNIFKGECELESSFTSSDSSDDEERSELCQRSSRTDDVDVVEEEGSVCHRYSSKQLREICCGVPVDRMPLIVSESIKESECFLSDGVPKVLISERPKRKHEQNKQRSANFYALHNFENSYEVPDSLVIRTAEVVYIYETKLNDGCRLKTVGRLQPLSCAESEFAIFNPTDLRQPQIQIPLSDLPNEFVKRPQDFVNYIFVAEMLEEWTEDRRLARGRLIENIGEIGNVEAEAKGLLLMNNIDTRPFPDEILASLKNHLPKENEKWKIEKKELDRRKDYRKETIFTIDPPTARDLDDALHVRLRKNEKGKTYYEVGVHIADVTYFVHSNTELDKWAQQRGTSVYLVDKVIPMLPPILCDELCSLNPDVDRLTFSVVWKMDEEGKALGKPWLGRTVIRSCTKLSYDHAQDIIDHPDKEFSENDLPKILCGKSISDVVDGVRMLHLIASQIRRRRFDRGALRIESPKLKFRFHTDSTLPCGVCLDERSDANFLVEEFMLLANIAVAQQISKAYPDIALLRRHPPPKPQLIDEMVRRCEKLGYPVEAGSTKMISASMCAYEQDQLIRQTVLPFLFQQLMRCMQLAVYFCAGSVTKEDDQRHYALNVDKYTHFTSPIRRFPDIIVHRILAASLNYQKKLKYKMPQLEKITQHCNLTKTAAKAVSDGSAEIFFDAFIREVGCFETWGIVTFVADSAFEVLELKYGFTKRILVKNLSNVLKWKLVRNEDGFVVNNEMSKVERCADFLANGTSNSTSISNKLLISFGKCPADKEGKMTVNEQQETSPTDEMKNENSSETAVTGTPAKKRRHKRKKKTVGSVNNAENAAIEKVGNIVNTGLAEMNEADKIEESSNGITKNADVDGKKTMKETPTFEMEIGMLSIVKVLLKSSPDPTKKHIATIIATPQTANLTLKDVLER